MMTSAIDLMRRQLPAGTRLGVLLRPESAEIIEGNQLVDEVIVYPYHSGSPWHGLLDLRSKIKAGAYNQFLSLDRRPRGAFAAWLAGIKDRIGPSRLFAGNKPEWWNKLLFRRTIEIQEKECSGSQVEVFQLVVRRAYDIKGRGRISLPPARIEKLKWAETVLPKPKGPLIGLCVRTKAPVKTWPAAGFAALIDKLHQQLSAGIYITGGQDDVEYIEGLIKMTASVPAVNLAGQTSLMDIQALAMKSDLFIGLDNAAAHLAANSGLNKMICLLLATKPEIIIDSMPLAKLISLAKMEARSGGMENERLEAEAELVFQTAKTLLAQQQKSA